MITQTEEEKMADFFDNPIIKKEILEDLKQNKIISGSMIPYIPLSREYWEKMRRDMTLAERDKIVEYIIKKLEEELILREQSESEER